MSRILAPLAIVVATAALLLCLPGGSEARSGAGVGGVGEEISSVEHTRAVLEGRDLEMEDEAEDIIAVDDDDDDDGAVADAHRSPKFFRSLDEGLEILGSIEDLREAFDKDEDEEDEEEVVEVEPRVSLIGSRVFLDRSDNVPEPEEAGGKLARDEPEGAEDATLPDVTSDEAMIETNEIPDSEGIVRAEDDGPEVEIATEIGVVEDDEEDDADDGGNLLEDTEVDDGGDQVDVTSSQIIEVETDGDVDDGEDEATVQVKDEEEEERMGIFRRLLSLLRLS